MTDVPKAIRLDVETNRLEIDWADDTTSRYAGAYVRQICPCAACRGHVPGEVQPPTWAQVEGVRITNVGAVGQYALRFTLSDGHESGIYSFRWLREQGPEHLEGVDAEGRPL